MWKYEEINIARIPVNPFYRKLDMYIYFIEGLLIDTGPGMQKRRLMPIFRNWDIEQVAITHHHEDHTGMAPWIASKHTAPIYCQKDKLLILQKNKTFTQRIFSGPIEKFPSLPFPSRIKTDSFTFLPVETPGHTIDHICLLEPDKGWLFTGDLYVTPHPKVFLKDESMEAYVHSLKKLEKIDFSTIFCAHQGVLKNGREKLKRKLDYLEYMRKEVIRLHELGFNDNEIRNRLLPERVNLETMTFGIFSRIHLIHSCYRKAN